jgi:hypothetical protein
MDLGKINRKNSFFLGIYLLLAAFFCLIFPRPGLFFAIIRFLVLFLPSVPLLVFVITGNKFLISFTDQLFKKTKNKEKSKKRL